MQDPNNQRIVEKTLRTFVIAGARIVAGADPDR